MNPLDSKLVERFIAAVDAEDAKAIEVLSDGNLRSIETINSWYGYRRALKDTKKLLTEAFEDLMKE